MRNPVAKYAGMFNRASVVQNSKKDYTPPIDDFDDFDDDDDDDIYEISWIGPTGVSTSTTIRNIKESDVTEMRKNLYKCDCTFVEIIKNGELLL